MNIFITGATGFIGHHLVKKLLDEGHIVHAIFRLQAKSEQIKHNNIKWFKGDILNNESLRIAMNGCQQVYHVAAYAAACEKKPGDFSKYNVQGTINVIETAKQLGINDIVVTSTAGVFGPSLHEIITEATVSSIPYFTGYERSKAESERIISDYVRKGMRIVIVNPTRVYGPGFLNESNSVTKMIKSYIEGKWHVLPGNGKSIGNYVFVNDVVDGHVLAMQKGTSGERYILGGDNVTYEQFFQELADISGKKHWLIPLSLNLMLGIGYLFLLLNKLFKITPLITPAHIRKFNYNWEVSSNKAMKELGFKITSLSKGFHETLMWLKK